jgi:carbon monoxide dehydrogenase subunit G
MDFDATYTFNAPVEQVWDLLMDTAAVGRCLPGCKGLKPIGDERYAVELGVAVAAVAGNFKGTVAVEDKRPPHSYRLKVEGSGRQGFVTGQADIVLESDEGRTRVRVNAKADIGGLIARLGQRLLEGVARTTMDKFYGCLAASAAERDR